MSGNIIRSKFCLSISNLFIINVIYCIQLNIQWITSCIKYYIGWPQYFNTLVFLLKAVDKKWTWSMIVKEMFYLLPHKISIDLIGRSIIISLMVHIVTQFILYGKLWIENSLALSIFLSYHVLFSMPFIPSLYPLL